MGMSTHIIGIIPPDATWRAMRLVNDACLAAGIDVPNEVVQYFDQSEVDSQGVRQDLEDSECCKEYNEENRQGFEIDLTELPEGVRIIRFYNSW